MADCDGHEGETTILDEEPEPNLRQNASSRASEEATPHLNVPTPATSNANLIRYLEQVEELINQFTEDVNFAKNRPKEDLDPDEAEIRIRGSAARIPLLQKRIDQLQEMQNALIRTFSDQSDFDGTNEAMARIDSLLFNFERMKQTLYLKIRHRPSLKDVFPPAQTPNPSSMNTMAVYQAKSADDYDATRHVHPKFNGDRSDKDYLKRYNSWRAAWDLVHEKIQTLQGYSSIVAFKHLKSVLEGEALNKIEHLNPRTSGAYESAMTKLEALYADKLSLAANYLSSLTEVDGDDFDLADAFEDSLVGLENMEETFAEEKVNPFQFSILLTFRTVMNSRPAMVESWLDFKERKRQTFIADNKEPDLKWHAGLVENSTTFEAWLDVFRATRSANKNNPAPIAKLQLVPNTATSHSFMGQHRSKETECFICSGNHTPTRCEIALAMTDQEWKRNCKKKGKCFRCLLSWTTDHVCNSKCLFCKGPHNHVICPSNKFRINKGRGAKRDRSSSNEPPAKKNIREKAFTKPRNPKKLPVKELKNEPRKPIGLNKEILDKLEAIEKNMNAIEKRSHTD